MDVVRVHIFIVGKEFLHPVRMLGKHLVAADVRAGKDGLFQIRHLAVQTGRKHRKAHHFDQADVLLLDVVQLRMGMIHAQRMLLGGDVVAQHQIQLIVVAALSGNGGDGVVGLSIRFRIDESRLIRVAAPFFQNHIRQGDDPIAVGSV